MMPTEDSQQASLSAPTAVDVTAATLGAWCAAHGAPYMEFAAWGDPLPRIGGDPAMVSERPKMFAGRVNDALSVPHDGYVCTSDNRLIYLGLAARDYLPAADLGARCIASDGHTHFRISLAGDHHRVSSECVYFGGNKNFGHFIFQCLLRLVSLNWLPELRGMPLAVYRGLPPRYLEFLDVLGFDASRRIEIPAEGLTRFDKVWLLSSPLYRRHGGKALIWPEAVWGLRLATAHLTRPFNGKRARLYIPRGTAGWRRLANEGAVAAAIQPYGVEAIDFGNLSAADQIAAVSNAELIVCVLGAASEITIFAPPDCAVIELSPPEFVGTFGPVAFADIYGQPFARLVGRALSAEETAAAGLPPIVSTNVIDKDFSVDIDSLKAFLAAADQYCKRKSPV